MVQTHRFWESEGGKWGGKESCKDLNALRFGRLLREREVGGGPLVLIIPKQTDECEGTLARASLGLHPPAKWLSLALRRLQSCLATPTEPSSANTDVKAAVWLFVERVLSSPFVSISVIRLGASVFVFSPLTLEDKS